MNNKNMKIAGIELVFSESKRKLKTSYVKVVVPCDVKVPRSAKVVRLLVQIKDEE